MPHRSRGHNLGFLVTLGGMNDRAEFLRSQRRSDFLTFAEQYVDEWYIFDLESGVV